MMGNITTDTIMAEWTRVKKPKTVSRKLTILLIGSIVLSIITLIISAGRVYQPIVITIPFSIVIMLSLSNITRIEYNIKAGNYFIVRDIVKEKTVLANNYTVKFKELYGRAERTVLVSDEQAHKMEPEDECYLIYIANNTTPVCALNCMDYYATDAMSWKDTQKYINTIRNRKKVKQVYKTEKKPITKQLLLRDENVPLLFTLHTIFGAVGIGTAVASIYSASQQQLTKEQWIAPIVMAVAFGTFFGFFLGIRPLVKLFNNINYILTGNVRVVLDEIVSKRYITSRDSEGHDDSYGMINFKLHTSRTGKELHWNKRTYDKIGPGDTYYILYKGNSMSLINAYSADDYYISEGFPFKH